MMSPVFACSLCAIILYSLGPKVGQALLVNNAAGECGRTLDNAESLLSINYSCYSESCLAVVKCKSIDNVAAKNWTFICNASQTVWLPANEESSLFPVNCTNSEVRNYDNSYSMLENSACAVPLELFPNGSYSLGGNISTLTYHCNDGFILVGARQRHCLQNQTWSEQIPRCIADAATPETVTDSSYWNIFASKARWQGFYEYNGHSIAFHLLVRLVEGSKVTSAVRDNAAHFELVGIQHNDDIIFNMTRLIESSDTFPVGIRWSVNGRLSVTGQHWTYEGNVISSQLGFSKFAMNPATIAEIDASSERMEDGDEDVGEAPSVVAMVVGISMALVAIVFAGILATFCVRRNGTFRQGHQSLTSFENPIYDCENVLK